MTRVLIENKNGDGHGLGTKSIAAFCKNIGGNGEFIAEDGVFTVYMELR
ncbi:MAG: GHKL domain-containing protein [Clostridia bacterium]|nr:GHKL domain-containing protein [Clostridia bacterium]